MKKRMKKMSCAYLRRSREKQEASLEEQLEWAKETASNHQLSIELKRTELEDMIAQGECYRKNVYLDNGMTGSNLLRPGLIKLIEDTTNDIRYSHVFVLNRSRFARPHHPLDATILEHALTSSGITLIFSDAIAEPGLRGPASIMQSLLALMQYSQSGEYLYQLAMNVLRGQIRNAKRGGWNGGDPPYGFERVLVDAQGQVVEWLEPKKSVHKEGCTVEIRPYYMDKIKTWIDILNWKAQGWGSKRIAQELNRQGIPSPDAGKIKTRNGVIYVISGSWSHTTVQGLVKNAAIIAIAVYGMRSTGGHGRIGTNGPRILTDEERINDQASKVTMNPDEVQVRTPAKYKPEFDIGVWTHIQQLNQERSVSQRAVPRTKDPTKYPLSCRLFDLTEGCGWTMNGFTVRKRKVYKCGRYHKSAGNECNNNVVDANAMLETVVAKLRLKLESYGTGDELRKILLHKSKENSKKKGNETGTVQLLGTDIKLAEAKIARLSRRIADEDSDDEIYKLLRAQLDRLVSEKRRLQEQLAQMKRKNTEYEANLSTPEDIETALAVIEQLSEIISTNTEGMQQFQNMLVSLDIRVGLNFSNRVVGEKTFSTLLGGIIALGGQPLPVPIYGRNNVNAIGRSCHLAHNPIDGEAKPHGDEGNATPSICNPSQREEDLLPKVVHAGA